MTSLFELLRQYLSQDFTDLYLQASMLKDLVALAWAIHFINTLVGFSLNRLLGLRPLEPIGVLGIFTSPFLHGNLSHICGNTLIFTPLAWFIATQGIRLFLVVSIAVMMLEGIGTWLFGRTGAPHVGASGVIYGYLGFLLTYGITSGRLLALVIAIALSFVYYRLIPGILPTSPRISWEGHLFGFFGGVMTALVLSDIGLSY